MFITWKRSTRGIYHIEYAFAAGRGFFLTRSFDGAALFVAYLCKLSKLPSA